MATSISVRLADETARALEDLAKATDRPKTYFVEKALESYLAEHAEYQVALDRLRDKDDPIVSSDIIRSEVSSTFDSLATMVLGDKVSKTLAWFDNGWGYAHRVVDLIRRFEKLDGKEVS